MKDPRVEKLADILVNFSLQVQKGERVLIENNNTRQEFVCALLRAVYKAGGLPFVSLKERNIDRVLISGATKEQLDLLAKFELDRMKEMDCYIGFSAPENSNALCDVSADKMALYNSTVNKLVQMEQRVPHTRWVVLRYPTAGMAQQAEMSDEAFEDFFFDVCTMDYAKMSKAMDPLAALMAKTDKVHIVSPNTNLTFSIKGFSPIKCDGGRNIPDGEVYTAPVKNSVNGYITYNTPSIQSGFTFENIRLEFTDGKISKAAANDTKRINEIFDIDEGARYVGEFALGVHPGILKPMKETLFDEKIAGSLHFTPGNSYDTCFNGNRSSLHWDLVLIQRPDYGGGEIYFDDVLIRKDGLFVPADLQDLN